MKLKAKKNKPKRRYTVDKVDQNKITLTAAHSLDDKITTRISKIFGKDKQIVVKIDKNLIGGIRIEVGDKLYDGSG